MKQISTVLACLLASSAGGTLRADVQTAAECHFSVQTNVTVQATPRQVWGHLINIASWWSPAHTFSGDSQNLSLRLGTGGGFVEQLPDGGYVRHMEVIYSDPGSTLRMSGALGPLQEYPLQGTMTISIRPDGKRTTISTVYHVAGHFPGGLQQVASAVDQVITEQFQRLASRMESKGEE